MSLDVGPRARGFRALLNTLALAATLAPLALGCGPGGATPSDAGGDAMGGDASGDGGACAELSRIHSLYPGPLYVRAGAAQTVALRLVRDRSVCPGSFTLTSADATVARVEDPALAIGLTESLANARVTGLRAGRTTLRVTQPGATEPAHSAEIPVVVLDAARPPCPMGTMTSGRLAPGSTVRGAAGSPLEPASVSVPAGATTAPSGDVTLACAADMPLEGFEPIGPAVTFGGDGRNYPRELPFTVPVNPALVPSMYELQVELVWSAPSYRPRVVPVADVRFTPDGRALRFEAPRLGTYQAVVRRNLGARTVRRRFNYRALMGFSMGAIGTSSIGTRNPQLFDFIMPLGGAADWGWFMRYARDFMFGGFCTAAQRAMLGDMACGMASQERTPPVDDLWMYDQHFEWWNFRDDLQDQGGTFDRRSYTNIFTDLAVMNGNPFMPADPADGVLPRGVPVSERMRTDAQRCMQPVVLEEYYDDEYNPDGTYPVITFCDGNRTEAHAAEWAGGQGNIPFSMALAVDLNRNGVRDRGEPVLRNFTEPFRDTGADGVASAMEPGYDPVRNPDPAGDDYDRQYNPAGTENNFVWEMGEPYEDLGLDGVRCPAGRTCRYDLGEGNGRFDVAPGLANAQTRNPRALLAAMSNAEVERLGLWGDGGTRDLFSFLASANHFAGAAAQRGADLHYFNNFSSLVTTREPPANSDEGFVFTDVDYAHLPRHVMFRYGFDDATMGQLGMGDGAHVGTVDQIIYRWYASTWWMQAHWPRGNRLVAGFSSMPDNEGRCTRGYTCSFEFRSPRTNRAGPVSIYLPPGYHRPENAAERYPVVYFLHGYGMEPTTLIATGLLIGNFMSTGNIASWQRPSKFIMVFPDGRCRDGDGCVRGTFYLDSPLENRARMETYFLDLVDFVDRTYRTRAPEEVEVTE